MNNYQTKTTVIAISVGQRTEKSKVPLSARMSAAHAVAVQIATRCQMDIISLVPYSLAKNKEKECSATVVYINNGRSLDDIRSMMKPEIDNRPQSYWMIVDIYEWQGLLDCSVSTRGTAEEWD
jgi:hypothetical protein